MAMVWAAILACSFLSTISQRIYSEENDRCASDGEKMMQKREVLIQQERFQETVDSFKKMMNRVEENTGKMMRRLEKDVTKIKSGLQIKSDCQDLFFTGRKQSGSYLIDPFGNGSYVTVYCDMETEKGGWTAIQERVSGSVVFNRTWEEYKKGFGNVTDSYWIGIDVIHHLTKGRNYSLYVSITLQNGTTLYELYNQFSISDESDNYRLYLGGPATGTLGDNMRSPDLSGMNFSTPDRDNDVNDRDGRAGNCAAWYGGGWWFNFLSLCLP